MDEGGLAGTTEGAEGGVAFIGVVGGTVLGEDCVVLGSTAVAEGDGVDAAAEVGMDGGTVALGKGVEHGLGGANHLVVAGETSATKEERLELGLDVVFVFGKGPPFRVGFGRHQVPLEQFESIACLSLLVA